jgi:hypothetical protein
MICSSKTVFAEVTLDKEEFDPHENPSLSIIFSTQYQIV